MSSNITHPITSFVRRSPLVSFFVLTYSLCWGLGAVLKGTPIIAPDGSFVGGILLAALIVAALTGDGAGLLDLKRRLTRWRVAPIWYLVVAILPVVLVGAVVALMPLFGGAPLDWAERPALSQTAVLLVILIVLPVGAPLAEEVAWRGFALPQLLASRPALTASLVLGVIWSLWHLPVILSDPALRVPVPFLLAVLPLSVLFTWLFVQTGGSVLIAVLFHAWHDVALAFVGEMVATDDYALMWWLIFAVQSLVAVSVVTVFGPNLTSRKLLVVGQGLLQSNAAGKEWTRPFAHRRFQSQCVAGGVSSAETHPFIPVPLDDSRGRLSLSGSHRGEVQL